jgi:hypothetical protein
LGTLLVSVYGGYFNGALGIVLLALFSLWGARDLNAMNGLKNALSFVLSGFPWPPSRRPGSSRSRRQSS